MITSHKQWSGGYLFEVLFVEYFYFIVYQLEFYHCF